MWIDQGFDYPENLNLRYDESSSTRLVDGGLAEERPCRLAFLWSVPDKELSQEERLEACLGCPSVRDVVSQISFLTALNALHPLSVSPRQYLHPLKGSIYDNSVLCLFGCFLSI